MTDLAADIKRINQALYQGKAVIAQQLCRELLTRQPNQPDAWFCQSQVALQLGDGQLALKAIEKAREHEPGHLGYRIQSLKTLIATHQPTRATAEALKLSAAVKDDAAAHSELGLIFNQLKHYPQARSHFERAVELAPGNANHYYNLATVLRFLGETSAAEAALKKALEINPSDHQARMLLSQLKSWTLADNHIRDLKLALDQVSNPAAKVSLNYALGKELEDIGDYEAAFEHLASGADIRRRHMQYKVEDDLAIFDAIARHYDADTLAKHQQGHGAADPIFIVGMPRTGSTLVERILSSHCQVHSCGELNEFALQLMGQMRRQSLNAVSPQDMIVQSTWVDFAAVGKAYMDSLTPLRGTEPRVIDKLPFNYLYIGLIHLALPNAKIIHVRRNPMDTCFAVYKQLFQNAYPFSYDLDELARYYAGYHSLMAHWHRVLPGRIHIVDYENLVVDTENEVRRLLAYCELDWQQECLAFHRNASASTTASASQVRSPLYASSVGKWRHYQRHLQPLVNRFKQAGIKIGE